jgi:hypothetical protein
VKEFLGDNFGIPEYGVFSFHYFWKEKGLLDACFLNLVELYLKQLLDVCFLNLVELYLEQLKCGS